MTIRRAGGLPRPCPGGAPTRGGRWPIGLAAVALAVVGQVVLDGDVVGRSLGALDGAHRSLGWLMLAAAVAIWLPVVEAGHIRRAPLDLRPSDVRHAAGRGLRWRRALLWSGVALALLPAVAPAGGRWPELVEVGADLGRSGNTAGGPGMVLWAAGLVMVATALARRAELPDRGPPPLRRQPWVELGLLVAITAVAGWLRCRHLATLPPEMISDHAEKLLDVREVLAGLRPVFFAANGGREPIQFYLTAGLVRLGLPLSFLTLKLEMAAVGVAAVPLVWLLGREVGGRRLGLLAAAVTGLMPWHLQITRLGLRAPLSPLFAAATFLALLRALRSGRRDAWLVTGAVAGLGLYGYTGFRPMLLAVPVMVTAAVVVARRPRSCWQALRPLASHAGAAALLGVLVALPLLRVAVLQPDAFWRRSLARVAPGERTVDEPLALRLGQNWVRTLGMFNRTADGTWALSPPGRPALEPVGGALLLLGVATAGLLVIRRRDWRLATVLAGTPAMLSASAMALAFPGEVPHLARAAGALPLVAVLVALPLERLLAATRRPAGRRTVGIGIATLLALIAAGAARRVFVEYRDAYHERCLPVSVGADVARRWLGPGGDTHRIVLVGWPDGWDWRAFAFELGDADWSTVMWGTGPDMRDAVDAVAPDPAGSLCFLGGPHAEEDAAALTARFPGAIVELHEDPVPRRRFVTVKVPPSSTWAASPMPLPGD